MVPSPRLVKALIVTICTLVSTIVAMVAGVILVHSEDTSMGMAVLSGGGAFTTSMLLCLAVCTAIGLL